MCIRIDTILQVHAMRAEFGFFFFRPTRRLRRQPTKSYDEIAFALKRYGERYRWVTVFKRSVKF